MNLTKKGLLLIGIISLGDSLAAPLSAQTSSRVLPQNRDELYYQLFEASKRGNGEIIKELIGRGANIEAQDVDGLTALHHAVLMGHAGCIKVLVDLGANIEAQESGGATALHYAACWGKVECIKMLIYLGANKEAQDTEGSTALHCAAWCDHVDCIKVLIDLGANIEAQENDGTRALHGAARRGHVECVKVLVDLGANVNAHDFFGRKALHWAAHNDNVECAKVLIDFGANIEAQDTEGSTALHWAASGGSIVCIKVLVALGANIEAHDRQGQTALYDAAHNDHVECIKVLLESRANPWVRDNRQRTALDLAILSGNENIIKAVVKLSYLLLHPPEGNLLSARNRVRASLWALSHGPVSVDSQTGDRRRIGLPRDLRMWVLLSNTDNLSDGDKSLCKALVYVYLNALRNGTSNKLDLLGNAKAAAVKHLLEELKKRFAYIIGSDMEELLDPDLVTTNHKSNVLAGINERINELKERIQDATVSSSTAVCSNSEKRAKLT